MEGAKGKKVTADRARPADRVREEVKPSFGWAEDSEFHYLLLDLPEFKKEEIKIQIDDSGYVNINGERQVSDNKYIFFEQSHKVPDNSDIRSAAEILEDGVLTVAIPKDVTEAISETETGDKNATDDHTKNASQEEENQNARKEHVKAANQEEKGQECGLSHHVPKNERSNEEFIREMFSGQMLQIYEEGRSMMRTAIQVVSKNKGIIIAAVLAFSLGVLVVRYAESGRYDGSLA